MTRINLTLVPALLLFTASLLTQAASDTDLIARGGYLARAGDCVGCHTVPGGREFAGGLPFATPFGLLYSTNITSAKDTGLGNYSLDMFDRAMRHGVAAGGNLYPAMPYTSYSLLTDEDIAALYAFLLSTQPVHQAAPSNEIGFPFNIRFGIKAWNLVNHDATPFISNPGKSERWNRGNYLVNALGHCGECHTPRDIMMKMDQDRPFQGELIGGYEAPDITAANLNRQNWTHQDLKALFTRGYSRKGTVFGGMYTVVYHSFRHLTDDDLFAVSSYLLDNDQPIAAENLTNNGVNRQLPGDTLYRGYCAGCHGADGQGKPNVAPGMAGNATMDNPSAFNTLAVVLHGIETQYYDEITSFYAMPGFDRDLDDQQLTDLINYLRVTWTSQPGDLTKSAVTSLRQKIEDSAAAATH
jgi:mono/diheme cytochrome c family protein